MIRRAMSIFASVCPAVLIMAPDPRDLVSRVNEVGGKRLRFPPTFRSCRTRRQGTHAKMLFLIFPLLFSGCATPPPPGRATDLEVAAAAVRGRRAFAHGRFLLAAEAYAAALGRARMLNDAVGIGDSAYNLAACRAALREYDKARELLREAQTELAKAGGEGLAAAWLLEARIAREQGKRDEAASLARKAIDAEAAERDNPELSAQIRLLRAALALDVGDIPESRRELALAGNAMRNVKDPLVNAEFAAVEGRLRAMEKTPALAAAAFERAAALYGKGSQPARMAEALTHAGENYEACGYFALAADRYYVAARSLFACGAAAQALKRIDSAFAAARKAGDDELRTRTENLFKTIQDTVNAAAKKRQE